MARPRRATSARPSSSIQRARMSLGPNPAGSRRMNFARRDWFTRLRSHPESGLQLSLTLNSLSTGKPGLLLSRPIARAGGAFAGAVVGVIYLDYFRQLFSGLALDEGSIVNLVATDGRIVTRHPFDERNAGRDISKAEVFRHLRMKPSGFMSIAGWARPPDRADRPVHARHLRGVASQGRGDRVCAGRPRRDHRPARLGVPAGIAAPRPPPRAAPRQRGGLSPAHRARERPGVPGWAGRHVPVYVARRHAHVRGARRGPAWARIAGPDTA